MGEQWSGQEKLADRNHQSLIQLSDRHHGKAASRVPKVRVESKDAHDAEYVQEAEHTASRSQ